MSAQQTGLLESPRRFLRFLRETQLNHHRLFAERMVSAGFEVRRVVRRSTHGIWGLYLRRGTVLPGQEIVTVKRTISAILRSLGVECPPREVEALTKADRVETFFIYAPGVPGTLHFYRGQQQWVPEPIEPDVEALE
jgi:hypothetical protein